MFDNDSFEYDYFRTTEYIDMELERMADKELGYDDEEWDYEEELDIVYDTDEIAEGIEPRKGEMEEILHEIESDIRQNEEQEYDELNYNDK